MFSKYLLTGATGFLGNTIAWMLHNKDLHCVALVMKDDPFVSKLPPSTKLVYGDILNVNSLDVFIGCKTSDSCLIHCAGLISIASKSNPMINEINVKGTTNLLSLALINRVKKTIYVSTIHAIPDSKHKIITEINHFDEKKVKGEYAKSKAIASKIALQFSKEGLDISVVHPSGIIGPGDWRIGQITNTIISYCQGRLSIGTRGGNNFVDVRDVAQGILDCADFGKIGQCYLLTGHKSTIKNILDQVRKITNGKKILYLPLWFVKIIAPFYEKAKLKKKEEPYLTPYSAYALGTNANYSNNKARTNFNFCPRPLAETIKDTVFWLKETSLISIDED